MRKRSAALGLDFGTASVRALVVDTQSGRELGSAAAPYAHGVLDRSLPGVRAKLPPDWALQHPQDYLESMRTAARGALRQARGRGGEIVGLGVDFTACTVLPTDAQGKPLCFQHGFLKVPHAYVKLWKHHGALGQAERMNALARSRGEAFIKRYGAGVSCEWLIPKALEVLEQAPEVYAAAERFFEAGDWVVWQLTEQAVRSSCMAGYKACWSPETGYPSADFLAALHPGLRNLEEKLAGPVRPAGTHVGGLTPAWAERLGLRSGTPVGACLIDAHAAVPACSLAQPGEMAIILGTSFCHMLLGEAHASREVAGISGSVQDGILPGRMGYEAGQAGGGDLWTWCARNCLSAELLAAAKKKRQPAQALLARRAAGLAPGASGLLALDWFNGNRSPLNRPELSGLLAGLTLATPPEAIYRALQEALAFGTRAILENFEAQGLPVGRLVTCGGIAEKDPAFLQILADVTGRGIEVARSSQASAVGAAIAGAVAAGEVGGGHADFASAAKAMGGVRRRVFKPRPEAVQRYEELFKDYQALAEHFGRGGTEVMRRLREGCGC